MPTKIAPICRANVMALAKAFAKKRSPMLKMTTVSSLVHGDPTSLGRFLKGDSSVTLRKYDEIMDRFEALWPDDLPKPEIVPVFNGNR